MENYKNYIIWGKYTRLNIPKHLLPIFISFHPNNTVKYKLTNIDSTKLDSLIENTKKWFENLVIINISESAIQEQNE